jgi:hydrogenase-4 component F
VFGVASLLLAALYVLDQGDIKRLLAYSSVEHMGILAIGVSFGAPLALAGVLLHVLAHAAAKGNAFMGAGVLVRAYGTKSLSAIRGAMDRLPWSGPLFLISVLALSALPPFGIFRSEFEIVAGGLDRARYAGAAILVALVTLLFGPAPAPPPPGAPPEAAADGSPGGRPRPDEDPGPAAAGTMVTAVLDPEAAPQAAPAARGEPSAWMVIPVLAGTAVLLLLGLHPPGALTDLLTHGAALLGGRP